jgi:hypothetical protein
MHVPTGGNLSGFGVGFGAARGGAPRGDHEDCQVQQRMREGWGDMWGPRGWPPARYNGACAIRPTGGNLSRSCVGRRAARGGTPRGATRMARYNSACAIRPTCGNMSGPGVGRRAARGGAPRGDHEGGQVHQNAGPARHGLQDYRRPGLGERDDRCFLQESKFFKFFIGSLLSTTNLCRKSPPGLSV